MWAAVTEEGDRAPSELESQSVLAIAEQIFDCRLEPRHLEPALPDGLSELITGDEQRAFCVGVLMCLPLVSGEARPGVVNVIHKVCERLGTTLPQLDLLRYAIRRQARRFLWRITRNAAVDHWGGGGRPSMRDWVQIARQAFIPKLLTNRRTAARYQRLEGYSDGSLGRALYDFYRTQGWALPGEPEGFPERFVVHECTHILTGYGTHPHGEMLTAVFTGGAKRRNMVDWLLVPLMQWHLKEPVASFSRRHAYKNMLQPDKYFHAMRRGMDSNISLMDDRWSFWDYAENSVEELRHRFNIVPALPELMDGRRWGDRHAQGTDG